MGNTATTTDDLITTVKDFYSNLYSDEPTSPEAIQCALQAVEARLTERDKISCEGPLTIDELSDAVKQLKTGRTTNGFLSILLEFL